MRTLPLLAAGVEEKVRVIDGDASLVAVAPHFDVARLKSVDNIILVVW